MTLPSTLSVTYEARREPVEGSITSTRVSRILFASRSSAARDAGTGAHLASATSSETHNIPVESSRTLLSCVCGLIDVTLVGSIHGRNHGASRAIVRTFLPAVSQSCNSYLLKGATQ